MPYCSDRTDGRRGASLSCWQKNGPAPKAGPVARFENRLWNRIGAVPRELTSTTLRRDRSREKKGPGAQGLRGPQIGDATGPRQFQPARDGTGSDRPLTTYGRLLEALSQITSAHRLGVSHGSVERHS